MKTISKLIAICRKVDAVISAVGTAGLLKQIIVIKAIKKVGTIPKNTNFGAMKKVAIFYVECWIPRIQISV